MNNDSLWDHHPAQDNLAALGHWLNLCFRNLGRIGLIQRMPRNIDIGHLIGIHHNRPHPHRLYGRNAGQNLRARNVHRFISWS